MESDFGLDLEDLYDLIERAEVLVIRFQLLECRLLVDTRSNQVDGPLVALVPRAASVEERFQSLGRLRPRFPLPERIMSFQWPRHVQLLRLSGIWARLCDRLIASGFPDVTLRCNEAFTELCRAEERETRLAIEGGASYQTMWQR